MFMRTQRLFLRPVFPEDWRDIYRGIADYGVISMLARAPWPYRQEDAQSFCKDANADGRTRFAITLPDEAGAPIIGMIGFEQLDGEAEELGYWIAQTRQGRGYATEAVRGMIEIAEAFGIESLEAGHFIDNPASGKVLRKAGFRETGEIHRTKSTGRGGAEVPTRRFVKWIGMNAQQVRPVAA
ncbi:GNAT family N-acetyltransferase [Aurantiacibacter marinus]|uniref:N-acetyltransferase domain-containing protein n=1 Tax=Aurantiacibacter marinus TaxID=874156 RepID=A0A0H0XLJ7_9SPHN|nr:GNAT family N-acetyltransferase [Aurantiacibacter marinus]KLI63463.1 hypothetical protein AAV99_06700 [Aurantiacibacter marinus]